MSTDERYCRCASQLSRTNLPLRGSRSFRRPVALVSAHVALLLSTEAGAFEHRHAVGIGYQSGHIATEESRSFHFRSFPLAYLGRLGGDWGAEVRIATLFPLRARQEELTFSPRAEYDRTEQYDVLVAPNYRFSEVKNWQLEGGLGPHFHYVRFRSTEYVEWSSGALGAGASATGRTPLSEGFFWGHSEVGVRGDLSYDFVDLSRGGQMKGGVQAQLLVFVGWALGASP